jgi:anti-sigma factor RsiW
MSPQNMRRRSDKHVDSHELNALVPSSFANDPSISTDDIREAEHHLLGCEACSRRVSLYRQLVNPPPGPRKAVPAGADCPKDEDVDWYEVAAGLWPELKSKQLLIHAAQCGHCGPLLRAALCVDDDPTSDEERLLAQLRKPSRPVFVPARISPVREGWNWQFARWLIPVAALIVVVGMFRNKPAHSQYSLSGSQFANFAANTYTQHAQGRLALDTHANSQQALNQWFKANSHLDIVLPSAVPGQEQPFRIEGARLLPVSGKNTAAYIAYAMRSDPVGLMVIPDSVAHASGGVVADFKNVSFHYSMVQGYKVVTWSIHGLTYGLVSREGNQTQQSCMVCHSAMKDRDLSHTPTPLHDRGNSFQPLWQ